MLPRALDLHEQSSMNNIKENGSIHTKKRIRTKLFNYLSNSSYLTKKKKTNQNKTALLLALQAGGGKR